MRWLRLLLPLAILAILAVVGREYFRNLEALASHAPPRPKAIDPGQTGRATDWHHVVTDKGNTTVEVWASRFTAVEEPSVFLLEGVKLQMHHKDNSKFDEVTCAKATYNISDEVLFSEGEVQIVLGVPNDGPPSGKLLKITSSGVRYESKSGKTQTDRPASFVFDHGDGKSTGADYDPQTKELHMRKDVELHWNAKNANGKAMTIQAGEVTYKEAESKVLLSPWSRLIRDTLTLNAAATTVFIKDQVIHRVEAVNAQGTDTQPNRALQYGADQMNIDFDDSGEIQVINGDNNAKLTSTAAAGVTDITANHVRLDFDTTTNESVLTRALANGQSSVVSKPAPKPGLIPAETRVLKSDAITLNMKPGGQYVSSIVTQTPGTLDFLPNHPSQRKRTLKGDQMTINYGEENQLESFRSTNVSTESTNPPRKGQGPTPPALTWSHDLLAKFDPKTGQMSELEQWPDFRYQEGPRQAKAEHATLDQSQDLMTLDGKARVWDDSGSTTAEKILLHQKSNEMNADGNVISVRMPDEKPAKKGKKDSDGSLLAKDEPMQGKSRHMTSRENNNKLHYEGEAIVWQGVNRVQADKIDINRKTSELIAEGHVVSQFVEHDKPNPADPPPVKNAAPAAPVFTVIKAPQMRYTDTDKIAYYQGGVVLDRTGLDVKSEKLRAYLKAESQGDSSLDKAIADGKVEIFQRSPDRTRQGFSEHAEYFVDDEKVFLSEGEPQLIDSLRGKTRGRQLTYFSNDDRLVVDGAPTQPATSVIRRHKK